MGFLDKLWDETVAGPTPETGLGKLRKYNSFSAGTTSTIHSPVTGNVPISRSITLVRPRSAFKSTSEPTSPADSITPRSPFSPEAPGGDFKKFTRRKTSEHTEESTKHRR